MISPDEMRRRIMRLADWDGDHLMWRGGTGRDGEAVINAGSSQIAERRRYGSTPARALWIIDRDVHLAMTAGFVRTCGRKGCINPEHWQPSLPGLEAMAAWEIGQAEVSPPLDGLDLRIMELHLAGMSIREIGERMRVSRETVRRRREKMGLPMPEKAAVQIVRDGEAVWSASYRRVAQVRVALLTSGVVSDPSSPDVHPDRRLSVWDLHAPVDGGLALERDRIEASLEMWTPSIHDLAITAIRRGGWPVEDAQPLGQALRDLRDALEGSLDGPWPLVLSAAP